MSYRFVVCIDVPGDDLAEGYRNLARSLGGTRFGGEGEHSCGWETSDEAYDPDGERIDPATLQRTIVAVLDEDEPAPFTPQEIEERAVALEILRGGDDPSQG